MINFVNIKLQGQKYILKNSLATSPSESRAKLLIFSKTEPSPR